MTRTTTRRSATLAVGVGVTALLLAACSTTSDASTDDA